MKKLFISQPMKDKTKQEILDERKEMIKVAGELFGEVEVIDSYFGDVHVAAQNEPLCCLGMSLELLANADIAMFAPGWENARGCKIEHECALAYGIDLICDKW